MRHLWSLLSGIAATAVVYALFALDLQDAGSHWAVARFIGAGLLLGFIGTLRTSPVGPVVAGLLLVTPIVLLEVASGVYLDLFVKNQNVVDLGSVQMSWFELSRATGLLAMMGALLFVAVFSAQRWKAWPKPEFDTLVDNGRIDGLDPWRRASADDTVPTPAGAHDGTTAQLWVPPPPR
jgi:hypothetical protein